MEEALDFIIKYGYFIIAFSAFGGGYLTLLAAGTLAAAGKLDIGTVLAVAFIFNFLGDLFFFHYVKFIKKFFRKDYNSIVKKYSRKVAYTKQLIRKKGWMGMFIQKYLYIIRTLYPIVLGTMGYSPKKFFILNIFASILWTLSLGLTSYFFSSYIMSVFN